MDVKTLDSVPSPHKVSAEPFAQKECVNLVCKSYVVMRDEILALNLGNQEFYWKLKISS